MNPLINIIKLFIINNNIYNKYNIYININYLKEYYKDIYKLFLVLPLYKEAHAVGSIPDFTLFFLAQYPAMKPEESELFVALLQRVSEADASVEAVVDYLHAYRQKEVATQIAVKAIAVSEGRADPSEIVELIDDFELKLEEKKELFVSDDLGEIYEQTAHGGSIRWRLETLNRMLGGLRQSNFGFVFARPETGKTTFLASEATFMASQIDGNLLWVNNEEGGANVMSRCYQAACGVDTHTLFANIDRYKGEYHRVTGGRIKILDDSNANKRQLTDLCKKLQPKLIILDQIDKIKGFDNDRYDLKMKEIYQWARELSKLYGPVIGTCQAGGTGENKKWLQMNDVDSSHTAKQGEADFVLGIGMIHDDNYASERYLHLAKNKLSGDADTLPALRHGKCPVTICPDIARYKDKLKWN